MSKTTTLGEAQLTQSPNETITVELIQPDDMPPIVRIGWPLQPTVIDPERFRDVAAAMVKLFSEAHVTLDSGEAVPVVKPRGRPQPRAQPGGISSTRSLCLVTYQPADGEASTTVRLKLVAASCVGALTG